MSMQISVLGPAHSYCHILASKSFPKENLILCGNIEEIFRNVSEDKTDLGIAPIENMLHGSVRDTIFALKNYKIKINKIFNLPINHCLASKTKGFKKIISHPQALAQCSKFLDEYRKQDYEILEAASTSKAMEIASQDNNYAAIGSVLAAKSSGLLILNEDIADNPDNQTSFILISKKDNLFPGEKMRTSMMITPKEDKPGLLYEVLAIFKQKNINLTKIESIPTGNKIGEYLFYIEVDGSLENESTKSAIDALKKIHDVYLFGSYSLENV